MIFKGERKFYIEECSLDMSDITDFIREELRLKKTDQAEIKNNTVQFANRFSLTKVLQGFDMMSFIDRGYIRIVPDNTGFTFYFQIEMMRLAIVALSVGFVAMLLTGHFSVGLGFFLFIFGVNFCIKIALFYSFLETLLHNLQDYIDNPVAYQRKIAGMNAHPM